MGQQRKLSLPRAPAPLHSPALPHYTLHRAREGKSALGLGRTQKKGCDIGGLRLHSPPPQHIYSRHLSPPLTTLPPWKFWKRNLLEFPAGNFGRGSREFFHGPLYENLDTFIVVLPNPPAISSRMLHETDRLGVIRGEGCAAQGDREELQWGAGPSSLWATVFLSGT